MSSYGYLENDDTPDQPGITDPAYDEHADPSARVIHKSFWLEVPVIRTVVEWVSIPCSQADLDAIDAEDPAQFIQAAKDGALDLIGMMDSTCRFQMEDAGGIDDIDWDFIHSYEHPSK